MADAGQARFAHGVLLAALVPYLTVMGMLLVSMPRLQGEERAFRVFVATIVAFAGVPVFLLMAIAVFGVALLVLSRTGVFATGAYALWGAGSALLLVIVMAIGGPGGTLADDLPALLLFLAVGAASGAAFRAGALRGPTNIP